MKAQHLKNAILQLAIQGKLVPQDPNDEPAQILLEKIQQEKQKLIAEGKIKKSKKTSEKSPYANQAEIPFDIPESWVWVKLNEIGYFTSGKTPKAHQLTSDRGIPYFKVSDMNTKGNEFYLKDTNIYLSKSYKGNVFPKNSIAFPKNGGAVFTNKKRLLQETSLVDLNTGIYIPSEINDINYIFTIFNTIDFKNYYKGTALPTIDYEKVNTLFFPLPPLNEQKRIVAKIEELLPLVEQYDQKEQVLTTLHHTFPIQLKKSILQAAIQGKLVEQNPQDEPANHLIERIQAEKARLISEKKCKKPKKQTSIIRRDNSHYELVDGTEHCIDEELPFDIPESWCWVRLQNISSYIQRGRSPNYSDIAKYPVISQKCIQWIGLNINSVKFIQEESLSKYSEERFLKNKDLLWNSTGLGTLGRIATYYKDINPYELAVTDSHVTVIRLIDIIPEYIYFYISNPTVQDIIEELADGSTKQKELSLKTIENYMIPIPPLSEQKRIVEKIEELFSHLQTLEKN